ncbi:MAG: helix-hairpin-helix domain-containing protein [Gammaproteobacteria bacterium]|nr:helix-hairpin-helix domain-containing protein [Gammaproteobacteria bacterium]
MKFNEEEKAKLLSLNGVGSTVIKRFEEIGISSFKELSKYSVDEVANRVADMLGTTCWKNSPQARAAIKSALELAKKG